MSKKVEVKSIEPIEPINQAPIEQMPVDKPIAKVRPDRSWRLGRIFWGLLLVLIGGLVIANNYGWVTLNWFNLWRLWPLVIVGIGLSILSIRGWAWRLMSVTILVLSLLAVAFSLTVYGLDAGPISSHSLSSERLGAVKDAQINLQASMGQININTAEQTAITSAQLDSNISKLTSETTQDGATQVVNLATNITDGWPGSNINNQLNLNVARDLPTKLALDVGATEVTADLSLARLQDLSFKGGVTKADIKLGNLESITTVKLDAGAGAFVVRVPASSGVSIALDGAVGFNNMNDLINKDGARQTADYALAPNKVMITGHLGLASLTLERY